jgi:hypothetical protein
MAFGLPNSTFLSLFWVLMQKLNSWLSLSVPEKNLRAAGLLPMRQKGFSVDSPQ